MHSPSITAQWWVEKHIALLTIRFCVVFWCVETNPFLPSCTNHQVVIWGSHIHILLPITIHSFPNCRLLHTIDKLIWHPYPSLSLSIPTAIPFLDYCERFPFPSVEHDRKENRIWNAVSISSTTPSIFSIQSDIVAIVFNLHQEQSWLVIGCAPTGKKSTKRDSKRWVTWYPWISEVYSRRGSCDCTRTGRKGIILLHRETVKRRDEPIT